MIWLEFLISAGIITFASIQLARYADVIGLRTKLGSMFAGTMLLATVTSIPEILTIIYAVRFNVPDLAAGNLFGSNMFNIMLLAVLDIVHHNRRISRKNAEHHALTGSLTILMIALAVFFIVAKIPLELSLGKFKVGLDGITMLIVYFLIISLLRKQSKKSISHEVHAEVPEGTPSLWVALAWFVAAALTLVFVTPWLVDSSSQIAEITGLGNTFIGSTLVAVVTSLPELVSTISAGRAGADDLVIGNLFGSNMFNMALIGLAEILYQQGKFFTVIDESFLLIAAMGMVMNVFALVATLARLERRIWFIELDALLLILMYLGGLVLLFSRGIAP